MKNLCLLVLAGFVVGALVGQAHVAHGIEPFKKEFEAKYVKKEPATDAEKTFAAAAEKAKCNVCHVGKTKKVRNEYGKALGKLVTKKDNKETAKIQHALDEVAAMKSKPDDPSSPTFGDLIKEGKLPGGDAPATGSASN
jgi:hypothetical protein